MWLNGAEVADKLFRRRCATPGAGAAFARWVRPVGEARIRSMPLVLGTLPMLLLLRVWSDAGEGVPIGGGLTA